MITLKKILETAGNPSDSACPDIDRGVNRAMIFRAKWA